MDTSGSEPPGTISTGRRRATRSISPTRLTTTPSGQAKGKIDSVDAQTSIYGCQPKDGQVKWGTYCDVMSGDSGSMTYHQPSGLDDIYVCSMVNAHTSVTCNAYGTGAYRLNNQHGYYW